MEKNFFPYQKIRFFKKNTTKGPDRARTGGLESKKEKGPCPPVWGFRIIKGRVAGIFFVKPTLTATRNVMVGSLKGVLIFPLPLNAL